MSEPFIGEIRPFSFNFAPRGWALCSGQILPINQNQALFSLLGTTYGGNGQTTFALPNLNGRVAISSGQGAGLSSHTLGEVSGTETVTLTSNQIPQHNHLAQTASASTTTDPTGALPGPTSGHNLYDPNVNTTMNPQAIGVAGGSQPHNNLQPYGTTTYCIALQGIFPPRN